MALASFGCYLALFPGSVVTLVARQVPAWGASMGSLLLVLQGIAACAWLAWRYGRHGLAAAALLAALAWAVEHVGEASGWPFGRYHYSDVLAPQLGGRVPLPIVCAWIMAALGAWQLAGAPGRRPAWRLARAATLVLVLDLQIEPVATLVNGYWRWEDGGPYYGVPTANFVAWWVVGALAAAVLSGLAARAGQGAAAVTSTRAGLADRVLPHIPALLYALSTVMFTAVNLAYGYGLAGLVGLLALALLAWKARGVAAGQTSD